MHIPRPPRAGSHEDWPAFKGLRRTCHGFAIAPMACGRYAARMSILILMRHAKAVRETEAQGDRARELTERGRRDAGAAAAEIADAGYAPTTIVTSPAARTLATARIVRDALAHAPALVIAEPLYLSEPKAIWSEVRDDLTDGGMIVVGHNPGMHALVADWIDRARDRSGLARAFLEGFPTSAWAVFEMEDGPFDAVAPKLVGGGARPRAD